MKSGIALLLVFGIMVSTAQTQPAKGQLTVTIKANAYNPPGDADMTTMVTADARYRLSTYVSLAANIGWSTYDVSGADITYVPIGFDGIVHFLGFSALDPYAGAGLTLNYRSYDYTGDMNDDTDMTGGMEFLTGLSYRPRGGNFGLDFDIKYRIEDLSEAGDSGSWSIGGGVTGQLNLIG
jgi:hypothetical protein